VPLNALPREQAFAFAKQDTQIIDRVEELAGETPAMLVLETAAFVGLLPSLVGYPRVTLGRNTAVEIDSTPFDLPLRAALEANGEIVVSMRTNASLPKMLGGEWVWRDQRLQPLGLPPALRSALQGPMRISRAQIPTFLSQLWPQLATRPGTETNFALEDFVLEPQTPKFLLELKGGLAQLTALLQCRYGRRILTVGSSRREEVGSSGTRDDRNLLAAAATEDTWLPDPSLRPTTQPVTSEPNEPRGVCNALVQWSGRSGPAAVLGQNAVLNFCARFSVAATEWNVKLEERLQRSTQQNLERIEPRFQIVERRAVV
jgi:hypothetical protein